MIVWCSIIDTATQPLDPSSPYDGPVVSTVVVVSGLVLPLFASGTVFTAAGWVHAAVWRRSLRMRSNYLRPGVLALLSLAWTMWLAWAPWLGAPFILATIVVLVVDARKKRLAGSSPAERNVAALRWVRIWTVRNQRVSSAVIGMALAVIGVAIVVETFFLGPPPTENTYATLVAAVALVGAVDALVWWLSIPGLRQWVRHERVARLADIFVFLIPGNVALVFLLNASLYSFSPEWR